MFRDIDVFSALPEAALLGATLGKALKMSIYSKSHPNPYIFRLISSKLAVDSTLAP